MVELTHPQKEPKVEDQAGAKLEILDASGTNPSNRADREAEWEKSFAGAMPQSGKIYFMKFKPVIEVIKKKFWEFTGNVSLDGAWFKIVTTIKVLKERYASIPFSYGDIQQWSTQLDQIHGISLMLCGGSWISIATFLSFCEVYHVQDVVRALKPQTKWPEMKSLSKSLHQLWMLTLLGYVTWKVPLVQKFTVALMLGKLTRASVTSKIMAHIEKRVAKETQVLGRWWPVFFNAAVILTILMVSIFTCNIQACLVLGSVGFRKVYSSLSPGMREQFSSIKGPFKLDGVTTSLWGSAIFCTVWQLWYCYESSLFRMIVPLGFLVCESNVEDVFQAIKLRKSN